MFRIRLKELREESGLSQYKFANKIGVSQSTVGNWESGTREPNFDMISKLAEFFNVTTDYLLGNSNVRNPEIVSSVDDDLIVLMSRGGDKKVIKLTPEKKEKVKKAFELVFDDDEDVDF